MSALEGIRVVDFGQGLAGPLAARLLADHGADVVRVDPPGGPRWATPAGAAIDAGKRRVVLDLKRAADREAAECLVAASDVVVENVRPGVMARLGLGGADLLRAHPHLVHCALPGFASDDPRAAMPAWEGVIAAATGTYWTPDGPRFTALPLSSIFGAVASAVAIVMALIARERDGAGQRIEVPLHDATVLAIGSSGLLVDGVPDGARPDDPWGGQFQCADGRWVRVSLATLRFVERFAAAAGRGDWIARGDVTRERPGPLARGTERRARLDAEVVALFRSRSARDWEDLAREAGVPITMVRTSAEWLDAEHPRAAALVAEHDDPELGRVRVPGLATHLSSTPGATRPRPPVEAFAPWPARAMAKAGEVPARPALDGLRVVDLTQVLAGPTAGRTLAEFGADVIKVNNPTEEGAGYRWQVHRYHTDVNRGKRTVLVDLKRPEGLDVVRRLIARADVVLHNFRPGVAERLGVGEDDVRRLRRDVVYGSIGFCGEGGPWADLPGYEPNAQAMTGMMARMAGATGMPAMQPFAPNDYATGLLGALAVGLGLFHRARGGAGQRVHTSLAAAATLLQTPYLLAHEKKTWDEPSGPGALGWSALQRLYRASDGWMFLGASAADLDRLAAAAQIDGAACADDEALAAALAERIATDSVARWVERLSGIGVGVQPVIAATTLMRSDWMKRHGLSVTREHAGGQRITTIGPPARLSRTPVTPGRPVSPPGGDAADVLREIGLGDRLDALVTARAISLD